MRSALQNLEFRIKDDLGSIVRRPLVTSQTRLLTSRCQGV
jgi:hypothetical protein